MASTWTSFMDMHSGGEQKLKARIILIQATRERAELVFRAMFNQEPDNVTCRCCGPDYFVDESHGLAQATGFYRGAAYSSRTQRYIERAATDVWRAKKFQPVKRYLKRKSEVKIVSARLVREVLKSLD